MKQLIIAILLLIAASITLSTISYQMKAITTKDQQIEGGWTYTVNNDKTLDQFINAVLYYQADSLGNSVSFWAED